MFPLLSPPPSSKTTKATVYPEKRRPPSRIEKAGTRGSVTKSACGMGNRRSIVPPTKGDYRGKQTVTPPWCHRHLAGQTKNMHRRVPVGGRPVTQLTVAIVPPCPDRPIRLGRKAVRAATRHCPHPGQTGDLHRRGALSRRPVTQPAIPVCAPGQTVPSERSANVSPCKATGRMGIAQVDAGRPRRPSVIADAQLAILIVASREQQPPRRPRLPGPPAIRPAGTPPQGSELTDSRSSRRVLPFAG
jgi:hypothetical protein